ncbi:MAG: hypothetical protein O7B25_16495 [Gammaproteobacteria bacterium]|nr:hypothetical protein [Gammaproteobacteria bacterium]
MSRHSPDEKPQNALLGDLESIRKLLEDNEDQANEPRATNEPVLDDIEVPVLEDIFDPGHNTDLSGTDINATTATPRLDESLVRVLLGDTWRESADTILKQAREVLDEHQTDWTPATANSLNDALKSCIDATIQDWISDIVVAHMAELHERMLEAVSGELKTTLDDIVKQHSGSSDGQ